MSDFFHELYGKEVMVHFSYLLDQICLDRVEAQLLLVSGPQTDRQSEKEHCRNSLLINPLIHGGRAGGAVRPPPLSVLPCTQNIFRQPIP